MGHPRWAAANASTWQLVDNIFCVIAQHHFKNVNNGLNTNIYAYFKVRKIYLETSAPIVIKLFTAVIY
jgi:hypothetical protein